MAVSRQDTTKNRLLYVIANHNGCCVVANESGDRGHLGLVSTCGVGHNSLSPNVYRIRCKDHVIDDLSRIRSVAGVFVFNNACLMCINCPLAGILIFMEESSMGVRFGRQLNFN